MVIVFATFFLKAVWPFLIKQVDLAQADKRRAEDQARLAVEAVAGLKETLVQHTELSRQMVDMLKDIQKDRR